MGLGKWLVGSLQDGSPRESYDSLCAAMGSSPGDPWLPAYESGEISVYYSRTGMCIAREGSWPSPSLRADLLRCLP